MHPALHVWWGVVVIACVALVVLAPRLLSPALPDPADDPATVPIPDDLVGLAMQYAETWAQDDYLKVCRERYAQTRDWNQVRMAMGVATAAR